jgi:hypothetical protein
MTLFGNILQNPLDPRARSDTRLMNVVVTFLSTLGAEAETGGVHRMLGVCAEFERIAKKVIEKAEKDQSSRRKRKSQEPPAKSSVGTPSASTSTPKPAASATTPTPHPKHLSVNGQGSPDTRMEGSGRSYSPMVTMREPSPALNSAGWPQEFPIPDGSDYAAYAQMAGYGPNGMQSPPLGMVNPFQQPLLPPDIYSLHTTLDWDWAEMSGGAYPSVENGNLGHLPPTHHH